MQAEQCTAYNGKEWQRKREFFVPVCILHIHIHVSVYFWIKCIIWSIRLHTLEPTFVDTSQLQSQSHNCIYGDLQTQIEHRKSVWSYSYSLISIVCHKYIGINSVKRMTVMVLNLISQLTYKMSTKNVKHLLRFSPLLFGIFCCFYLCSTHTYARALS